jgi:hypothetical protein
VEAEAAELGRAHGSESVVVEGGGHRGVRHRLVDAVDGLRHAHAAAQRAVGGRERHEGTAVPVQLAPRLRGDEIGRGLPRHRALDRAPREVEELPAAGERDLVPRPRGRVARVVQGASGAVRAAAR